jgi:hypothetical protein
VTVYQARAVAARWVAAHASFTPGFAGALLGGSASRLPADAELPLGSDVDIMLVTELAEAPPRPGKFLQEGVLLEASWLSRCQLASSRAVLGTITWPVSSARTRTICSPTPPVTWPPCAMRWAGVRPRPLGPAPDGARRGARRAGPHHRLRSGRAAGLALPGRHHHACAAHRRAAQPHRAAALPRRPRAPRRARPPRPVRGTPRPARLRRAHRRAGRAPSAHHDRRLRRRRDPPGPPRPLLLLRHQPRGPPGGRGRGISAAGLGRPP